MEKKIAPSERKAQELRALLQGQLDAQSGEELLSTLVRLSTEQVLQEALEEEQAVVLGRERYERRTGQLGSRNGYEPGTLKTAEGVLRVRVPQVRGGQEPYRSATRVFWIVDNGSSHRGDRAQGRLQAEWPRLVLVHTPVHASWLNQIEIYFSIVQRQVLTPNDFPSLAAVKDCLLRFQVHYAQAATPFQWTFTRRALAVLLAKLARTPRRLAA